MFNHRCNTHARTLEANPTTARDVLDISCAKHRFESLSKPLGRGVIYWQALVITAQQILDERGLSEAAGRSAAEFLLLANEEVMITLAMLADGADDVMSRWSMHIKPCVHTEEMHVQAAPTQTRAV